MPKDAVMTINIAMMSRMALIQLPVVTVGSSPNMNADFTYPSIVPQKMKHAVMENIKPATASSIALGDLRASAFTMLLNHLFVLLIIVLFTVKRRLLLFQFCQCSLDGGDLVERVLLLLAFQFHYFRFGVLHEAFV